jgi:glutamine synthetase
VVDGKVFDGCSRRVLLKQIARLSARGWTLNVGIEPEFFLVNKRCAWQTNTL